MIGMCPFCFTVIVNFVGKESSLLTVERTVIFCRG